MVNIKVVFYDSKKFAFDTIHSLTELYSTVGHIKS